MSTVELSPAKLPEKTSDKAPEAKRVTLSGQLSASAPVRDAQIGIAAPAVLLLRHVEIFEWTEHCVGDKCEYRKEWAAPVDSSRFKNAHGHQANPLRDKNPKPPFADARFVAAEIRLDAVSVDPALVEQQLKTVDLAVKPADLPPNMAATFTVSDGLLYAGGDPAHPDIGTVRIGYRIIPTGPATLSGLQKGTHLTQ